MRFTFENIGSYPGQEIVTVQAALEERVILMGWIETSLRVEQNAQAGHPLTGALEFQMGAVKSDRLDSVHSKLESGNSPLLLTRQEFWSLALLAEHWLDRKLLDLDDYAAKDSTLYMNNPYLREYVLSDAFQDEIKIYRDVVTIIQQADKDISPNSDSDTTV